MDVTGTTLKLTGVCVKGHGNGLRFSGCCAVGIPLGILGFIHAASIRILPARYCCFFRGQAVRFNQPSGKHMVFPYRDRNGILSVYDIVSIHVDGYFHILFVRILVMGTLVKRIIIIPVVQGFMVIDFISVLIFGIKGVFVGIPDVLITVIVIAVFALDVGFIGFPVVDRMPVNIQNRVHALLKRSAIQCSGGIFLRGIRIYGSDSGGQDLLEGAGTGLIALARTGTVIKDIDRPDE